MKSEHRTEEVIACDVTIENSTSEISSLIKIRKNYEWAKLSSEFSKNKKNNTNQKKRTMEYERNEQNEHFMRDTPTFKMYIQADQENFQEEEIVERIEGFYVYDYNILKIHEIILKKFERDQKKELSILKNKLELEKVKVKGKQNLIERKACRKHITDYETEIKNYEEEIDKKNYSEKAKPFIEAYQNIGKINNIVSFLSNDKQVLSCPETKEQQDVRHRLISNYLEIARKYIPIDLVRKLPENDICLGCGVNTNEVEMIEDDSDSMVCANCGLEKINIIKSAFYSDGGRINNCRNNYEDRANFEKVLMRYQGKQITKPGRDLYIKLDEYFISRGLSSSKEYNDLPLLPDGTKEGSSREMMFEILSNIGCSGYYDDINLICSVFFGWSLPDVTHLEEDIMRDYDEFQAVYDQLPDRDGRKSSLNSQWKLFILLKRRDWPCKSKDFKIPTTSSILEYHKIKTKQIYEILGWQCPY